MDTDAYRHEILSKVRRAEADTVASPKAQGFAAAARSSDALADEICALSLSPESFEESVRRMLSVARDTKAPVAARLAALQRLTGAEFHTVRFEPFAADFTALMRRLATDSSARLREAALERLTLGGDREAQKFLRESLSPEGRTLVRPEKAVQWLARDDHASAKALFRDLAQNSTGKVRLEAIRALANDSRSGPLIESIAADKNEASAVREVAAASLKSAAPPRFAKFARKLVLDADDDDRVRAAVAVGIAHTKEIRDKLATPGFVRAVSGLETSTRSRALRKSARQLVKRLEGVG